ncbi:hypothetical protein MXD61_13530 [Frankia sp. AgPm24]|uniref:hypothetical protein n=1 Tax=Frankia sp. AgPm24 TaxID=631128 RepID=UPI00200CC105|nr:hypothetical protein [Frankia sp. AgPm24]MCK9922878.1 hypothetical protein [Frankia sp. AgPm24]
MTESDGGGQAGRPIPDLPGHDSPEHSPSGWSSTAWTSPGADPSAPATPRPATPGPTSPGPATSDPATSGLDLHGRHVTYDGWAPPTDDPLFGGPRNYAFSFDHLPTSTDHLPPSTGHLPTSTGHLPTSTAPSQPTTVDPSTAGPPFTTGRPFTTGPEPAGGHELAGGQESTAGQLAAASEVSPATMPTPVTRPGPTRTGTGHGTAAVQESAADGWPSRHERPASRAGAGENAPHAGLRATGPTSGYRGFATSGSGSGSVASGSPLGYGPDGFGSWGDDPRGEASDGFGPRDEFGPDPDEPGRRPPRAWRMLLVVAGAVVVLIAAVAVVALRGGDDGGSPGAQPTTAVSLAPIPANFLESVSTDVDPIRADEFFADTSIDRDGRRYQRIATRLDSGCPQLTGQLTTLFAGTHCAQVVRALLLSTPAAGTRQVLTGVTVFRLDTSTTATQGAQVLNQGSGGIAPLPIPAGSVRDARITGPGGNNSWRGAQSHGHYLVYTQVAYVDGTAGAATDVPLRAAQTDLAALATEPIGDRAVLGHGPRR